MPNTTTEAHKNARRLQAVANLLAIHIPREDQDEIEEAMAEADQLMESLNNYLNSHFWRWQCPKCKNYPALSDEEPHICETTRS